MLAIIKALNHFRSILLGTKIIVKTDHNNLVYIAQCQTNRAQRWKLLLDEFNVELHHVKGEENVCPDLLSRCLLITKGSLQQDNQSLLALITHSENSQRLQENSTKETNVQKISKDCFFTDQQNRKIVPNNRIDEFLRAAHEHLAHSDIYRLCKTLSSEFLIKNIFHRIQHITTNRQVCQLNKSNNTQYGKLTGFLTAKKPFERIDMDLLGPIDITAFKSSKEEGKAMVLVIIDIFSKWIRIVLLKRITAACVVKALRTEWIEKYGRPKDILTDQGRQFISAEFSQYLEQQGIKHSRCSTYNPTGNSVVERANRVIGTSLRCLRHLSFEDAIKQTERSMQTSYHFTLNATPHEVIY